MSQEQAERARQQLYEDVSTRDELTDDEAEVLLHWGEAQIEKLASTDLNDEQFDEAFANLSRMMKRMNRFAARRAEQAPDEQQESLGRIVESAAAAGLTPVAETLPETISAQDVPDTLSNLQALIQMFTPPNTADLVEPSPDLVEPSQAIIPAEPHSLLPLPIEESIHDEEESDEFEEE